MAQPFRETNIRLEEEAMAGSTVEARQAAERAAVSKANRQPSTKEIKQMPADVAKETIQRVLSENIERAATFYDKAEQDLLNLQAEIELSNAEYYAQLAEAGEAAAAAELAAAEGDKFAQEATDALNAAIKSGIIKYTDLPDGLKEDINKLPEYSDAGLAAAVAALSSVGVDGLTNVMAQIRELYPDIKSDDALMLLKFDPRFNSPYLERFQGNKMLMDKGFAPLDDKVYLANEQAYSKIFTAYDLKTFNNRTRYAELIGNLVAPEEVGERVSNVYERVTKGPQDVNKALKELYPELTTQDLMAYALDPKTQLPALKRKIQAAEIGGAALAQGLSIASEQGPTKTLSPYSNVQRTALGINTLVSEGVTREQAVAGYSAVAGVLEGGEKLSAIYGKDYKQYGRLQAEQEAFLKSAEAKATREKLVGREIAEYSGSSGRLASRDRAAGII